MVPVEGMTLVLVPMKCQVGSCPWPEQRHQHVQWEGADALAGNEQHCAGLLQQQAFLVIDLLEQLPAGCR